MAKPPIDYLIVPSAGSGSRMGGPIAKQFQLIMGKPVIVWTLEKFLSTGLPLDILVPTSGSGLEWFASERKNFPVLGLCKTFLGGETRYDSVKNALPYLQDDRGLTLVHDAARPLVGKEVILKAYHTAMEKGSAIPCVALKDSIREADGQRSQALDRSRFRLVQTPQAFWTSRFIKAYEATQHGPTITDDASVLEQAGEQVTLSEGHPANLKLTTPEDLWVAEALLKKSLNAE